MVSKRLCVSVSLQQGPALQREFSASNRIAGIVSPARRARAPCQNGGVVLKMTAKNERIRRERELIHALELLRRRAPDASEPAMKAGVAIKVAGWDIRFYTFDLDSRQH